MYHVERMYINGKWVVAEAGDKREIINPANGEVIAFVTEGGINDTRKAINAANDAFYKHGWWETSPKKRAELLYALADEISAHIEELAELETLNNGKILKASKKEVEGTIEHFRYFAGLAEKFNYYKDNLNESKLIYEPIGVCGLIVPWNYPLSLAGYKLAPALAAGNTVIFKPSELTPLTSIRLVEFIEKVGFPAGVVNLVLGAGNTVGNEIALSKDVAKISFTGGTETGRKIMMAAAGNFKKVTLELGGKSPNIVFADADFETAVEYALYGIFYNQGQICCAGSRLLVEEGIYHRFTDELVKRAKKIKVGNGMDPDSKMGPLISKGHMKKVLEYIETGIKEGATLLYGGNKITDGDMGKGFFVEPTIFTDINNSMKIAREEIFGPVLVIQRFKDEEEAISIANETIYGLAAAIFTKNPGKAARVADRIRCGTVWVNTYYNICNDAPFGGYKQSGIGREFGTYGYEEYTELKHLYISRKKEIIDW